MHFKSLCFMFLLLAIGANATSKDEDALFEAIELNRFEAFRQYDKRIPFGPAQKLALPEASELGRAKMVQYLLDKYSFSEFVLGDSLSRALAKGRIYTMEILLKGGAPVNFRDAFLEGREPLMEAARRNYLEATTLLIGFGASIDSRCDKGLTAYDYAKSGKAKNNEQLLALLKPVEPLSLWKIAIPVSVVAIVAGGLYYLHYRHTSFLESLGDCPICQETMKEGPTAKLKACGHRFHKACLFEMADSIDAQKQNFNDWAESVDRGINGIANFPLNDQFRAVLTQLHIGERLGQVNEDDRATYLNTLIEGKWKGTEFLCPVCRMDPFDQNNRDAGAQ